VYLKYYDGENKFNNEFKYGICARTQES